MYLPIRLVIADDHEVYRDGLRTLLEKSSNIEVVAEASNGQELIEQCKQFQPDIALTDIMMPSMDGIEATISLSKQMPSLRIIALSMYNQDGLILDMLTAGAMGYLIKNASKAEILEAIQSVHRGVPYYCKTTSMKLAKLIGTSRFGSKTKEKSSFNAKELEVIRMICEEKTSKEIADKLCVSPRTVEEYRDRIREKMNVKSSAGIVIYAIRNDLYKM